MIIGRHVYTYVRPVVPKDIRAACDVIEDGGIIAYPSDVNWAFACDGSSSKALDKIRLLKPTHPKEQPFSLVCSSISMASSVANVDNVAFSVMRKCCPGAFTFLLDRSRNLPKLMHDKRKMVGIRIPDCEIIQAILETIGKPLATASIPACVEESVGGTTELVPPKFGYQVEEAFGHGIDLILDLSEESPASESTIISIVDGQIEVVRQGLGDLACLGLGDVG